MFIEEILQEIESLTKKTFEKAGVDLIEFKGKGTNSDLSIQIIADKPNGGISIGECAILNKSLAAAIEQESLLSPGTFSLELSSPGLDRALVTRQDFMRVVGRELYFWLNEPIGGKKEVQGILAQVGETSLTISIKGKTKLTLPLSSIIKGMLVI